MSVERTKRKKRPLMPTMMNPPMLTHRDERAKRMPRVYTARAGRLKARDAPAAQDFGHGVGPAVDLARAEARIGGGRTAETQENQSSSSHGPSTQDHCPPLPEETSPEFMSSSSRIFGTGAAFLVSRSLW